MTSPASQRLLQSHRYDRIGPAVALFCLTFCSLGLEISLTRLFSVVFLQGYVYLLISLSMAGLGFGAVWVYFLNAGTLKRFFWLWWFLPLSAFALIIGANLLAAQFVLSLLPTIVLFACIGAATTYLFQRSILSVPLLYFIDLCGAASGAIAAYFLLNTLGAPKAILVFLLLISLSGGLIHHRLFGVRRWLNLAYLIPIIATLVLFCIDLTQVVSPQHNRLKDMSRVFADATDNPRVTATRWTAFGRSDLVETDNPLVKTLYIDGAAGTKMLQMENGVLDPALKRALVYEYIGGIPLLPLPERQRQDAVVIGSGGGIDVVTLLTANFRNITAVEINPDFIALVRAHRAYNDGIYSDHPQVNVVHQEGRAFLRSTDQRFDLIHMSLPIIKSARNTGSYALTENHLFTYEAFGEYWDAMKSDGYLIIVAHYVGEAYRLVSNAVKALELKGMDTPEALHHMVLVGRDTAPALIIRKRAFSIDDAEVYYGMTRVLHQEGSSNFIPHVDQHIIEYPDPESGQIRSKPMINELLYGLSKGDIDLETYIDRLPENAAWISDDAPFFYQMDKFLPREIAMVLVVTLILLLGVTLLFVKNQPAEVNRSKGYFGIFGLIGTAFMAIEIATIQQFVLFLGHQTLALTCLLAIILLCTGLGSYISGRMTMSNARLQGIMAVMLPFIGGLYFLGRYLVMNFPTAALPLKIGIVTLLLFPPFFLMGFPFPTLLARIRNQISGERLIPWMIGVNSIATMLGGSLAIVLAMLWGYSGVFVAGIILYGGTIPILARLPKKSA
jgi:predicted membrane-bound spermidine synthase